MSNELKVIDLGNIRESIEKDEPVYYEYYIKSEVDKVIAEKDAQILDLIEQVQKERSAKVDYKISANDLNDGLKKAYEKIRSLKRVLWLARAQRANEHYHRYHGKFLCPLEDIPEYVKWKQVERKCRAKAEEYK